MSVHGFEADVLRRRSLGFLEQARVALERSLYDVACFLAEQALQLYLKHALLRVVGDYPRTHSLRRLLGELGRAVDSRMLEEFVRANRIRLSVLEDAYLMARYFVKEYGREDAEDMVKLAGEAISIIEEILGEGGSVY